MPSLVSLAWEFTPTTGTGTINLSGSAVAGYLTLPQAGCVSATVYEYAIHDGANSEIGEGTFTTGTPNTFSRTTIRGSTNGGAAINLSGTASIQITPSHRHFLDAGTACLFQQTSAPTGWTKQTTHNDKALRVVSGTASSGGSNAFSTVMAQTVVGSTTISTSTMPSHAHTEPTVSFGCGASIGFVYNSSGFSLGNHSTDTAGSGGSHNHTITMAMQYVDIIIATKD